MNLSQHLHSSALHSAVYGVGWQSSCSTTVVGRWLAPFGREVSLANPWLCSFVDTTDFALWKQRKSLCRIHIPNAIQVLLPEPMLRNTITTPRCYACYPAWALCMVPLLQAQVWLWPQDWRYFKSMIALGCEALVERLSPTRHEINVILAHSAEILAVARDGGTVCSKSLLSS